jgi:hypothetical protein
VAKKTSKKSASSSRRGSSKRTKEDAPALKVERLIKPDKAAARPIGPMSGIEIGHVAGDVWDVLSRRGELTLAALKKEVPAPEDLILAAIGWLAREDKLEFSAAGRSVKVALR